VFLTKRVPAGLLPAALTVVALWTAAAQAADAPVTAPPPAASAQQLSAAALMTPVPPDDNPWDAGSNWLYLRAGFARSGADGAGNGGGGYGVGFRHMLRPSRMSDWRVAGIRPLRFLHWTLFKQWSVGGFVEYDVLGRFGSAQDVEVPVAVELTRHIRWKSAAKPYVSFGLGQFYRKTYNTGRDFAYSKTAGFVAGGVDAPVTNNQLLGVDVRMAVVESENTPVNPVFGPGSPQASHWSFKLSYSYAY